MEKNIITIPLELKITIDKSGKAKVTSKLLNLDTDISIQSGGVIIPSTVVDSKYIVVCAIYDSYKLNIKATARLTNGGIKKIKERLKTYSETELEMAIQNFSKDSWWMQNNSSRGVEWFFKSDSRIDQFLNLDVKQSSSPITIK